MARFDDTRTNTIAESMETIALKLVFDTDASPHELAGTKAEKEEKD